MYSSSFLKYTIILWAATVYCGTTQRRVNAVNLGSLLGIVPATTDGAIEATILGAYLNDVESLRRSQHTDDFKTFNTTVRYLDGDRWNYFSDLYEDPDLVQDQSNEPLSWVGFSQALSRMLQRTNSSSMFDPLSVLATAFVGSGEISDGSVYKVTPLPCRVAFLQRLGAFNPYTAAWGLTAVLHDGTVVAVDNDLSLPDPAGSIGFSTALPANYSRRRVWVRPLRRGYNGTSIGAPGVSTSYTLDDWQYTCRGLYTKVWHAYTNTPWAAYFWPNSYNVTFVS